ncbi:GntR family transcriptional regulator [Pseudoduganella eburnea]|uniref:GntR family transcriptional regulator n=1 Tax=Massilia eburnea TaxID=1776165 RepID=A0A6L6QBV1_9BURK|nr:GntR family transcriptional regulator [Massilia eburnea]MTW09962.1 GntR family transcriptional regulator [Massilia eburnea]
MARAPTVSRRSVNLLLDHIMDSVAVGEALPTEHRLAALGEGSRSAVRSAIAHFFERGLISGMKERRLLRKPRQADYFDVADLQSGTERVRQVLMELIYQGDWPPGTEFSEAHLARAAGVSTISVREFLIGFSRYGLIRKRPQGGWRLCAFDRAFAMEVAEVRQMFELAAIERFAALAADDPAYAALDQLIARHEQLGAVMPARHQDFPALDRDFHTFLIGCLDNRFAQGFYDIVSLVFHYHYQWDKGTERVRNEHAVHEHLAILHALARRDTAAAMEGMRVHLGSARSTLLQAAQTREPAHYEIGQPQQ